MADDRLFHLAIWFRLIERGALTLCVLLTCIWLTWKYLHKFTKLDFSDERLSPSKISFTIGTPFLIALLFVGYCYIDLSNPVEVRLAGPPPKPATPSQAAASSETQASAPILSFRGLGDSAGAQTPAHLPPIDAAAERQALEDRAHLDFALWTEQSLRQIFTTLANLPNPSRPSNDRVLNLSLAIGCLNSETFHPSRNIDTFAANKTFDQVETEVRQAVASKSFATGFCNALKLEP
jgi:hypothetical protein